MNRVVIHLVAAAAAVPSAWSSSALAQEEPPEVEIAPAPPSPPVIRVRPAPPARPPTVVIAPGPRRILYEETAPNPELLGSGLMVLGLSWGASVVVGLASDRASDQFLYVPLAGPWMDLANRESCQGPCSVQENTNRALLVAGGLVQAAGAVQILGALLFPETRIVARIAGTPKGVHVAPTAGRGAVGLTAYGAF